MTHTIHELPEDLETWASTLLTDAKADDVLVMAPALTPTFEQITKTTIPIRTHPRVPLGSVYRMTQAAYELLAKGLDGEHPLP